MATEQQKENKMDIVRDQVIKSNGFDSKNVIDIDRDYQRYSVYKNNQALVNDYYDGYFSRQVGMAGQELQNQEALNKTKKRVEVAGMIAKTVASATMGGFIRGVPGAVLGGIDGLLGTNMSQIYAIAQKGRTRQDRAFMKEVDRLGRMQTQDSLVKAQRLIQKKYGDESYLAVKKSLDTNPRHDNDRSYLKNMINLLENMRYG